MNGDWDQVVTGKLRYACFDQDMGVLLGAMVFSLLFLRSGAYFTLYLVLRTEFSFSPCSYAQEHIIPKSGVMDRDFPFPPCLYTQEYFIPKFQYDGQRFAFLFSFINCKLGHARTH
jgi:hypothetical protein